ncbi:MAG: hypothetical protein ABW135_09205 [Thermoleophilaceae bacterium]
MITATATTAPSSSETGDLVNTLRDDTIPKATKDDNVTAYVGGQPAG